MPVGYWLTVEIVAVEPIRRLAVHVFPRAARFGNGDTRQHTANTTATRLRVLVLVERLLRSAVPPTMYPKTGAPFAREVPRLDLLEGPFLRAWAFFVCWGLASTVFAEVYITESSVGRELQPPECVPPYPFFARPGLASYFRPNG